MWNCYWEQSRIKMIYVCRQKESFRPHRFVLYNDWNGGKCKPKLKRNCNMFMNSNIHIYLFSLRNINYLQFALLICFLYRMFCRNFQSYYLQNGFNVDSGTILSRDFNTPKTQTAEYHFYHRFISFSNSCVCPFLFNAFDFPTHMAILAFAISLFRFWNGYLVIYKI